MVKNKLFSPITKNTLTNDTLEHNVKIEDADKPLSYKQWLYRSHSIKHGFEFEEYNNYLTRWNRIKEKQKRITEKIKDDYKAFIKSIYLFFDEDTRKRFDNEDFDLDNILNAEEIIPHCARKLRDIMVYYQNKRDAIKRAKLRYNLVGTDTAIERLLHEYILRAFTKHGTYIKISDSEIYEKVPDLYEVNNSLEIKVKELYDDSNYMDKSPTIPSVVEPGSSDISYFGTLSDDAIEFYKKNGYNSIEEINWLLGNGFMSVVGNDNPIAEIADDSIDTIESIFRKIQSIVFSNNETADLPASAYIDYDKTNTVEYYQRELSRKYLGEDQYIVSGGYYINQDIDLDYDLVVGNNWISFPSGEGEFEKAKIKIRPISLNACTLIDNLSAIGSDNYINADKIFLRYGDVIEGAWLKDTSTSVTPETMVCNIYANRDFSFRFPYSDFGISGEGIEWSGPGLDNSDETLYTLPAVDRNAIIDAYWQKEGLAECNAISLNKTTLIDCGAIADTFYDNADKVTVREGVNIHDSNPNGVYNGEKYEAFLYKILHTDIPVRTGKNYIYWPYQNTTVDGDVDLPKEGCEPVCITGDEWRTIFGSRAGYGLFDSDIIYKLDAPSGNPIECAFLKGVPFTDLSATEMDPKGRWINTSWTDGATGCFQTGRYTKCFANSYVSFIWLDDDTPMDDVVFHIDHQPDCPYRNEKKFSLYENNPTTTPEGAGITFKEWHKCDCGAIKYSPFGHPGEKYEDYSGFADCCFVDNTFPLPFDKNIWFGEDNGKNYLESEDFGWYQLTGTDQLEPDIGWGKGRWVAGGNGKSRKKFMLKKGRQYKYFRTGIGHSDTDIIDGTIAPIIITHKLSDKVLKYTKPRWMKAVMNADGTWEETTDPSTMVINPDDNIVYDHINTEWWCITGNENSITYEQTVDINPTISADDYLNFVEYNVVPVSSYMAEAAWPSIPPAKGYGAKNNPFGVNYTKLPVNSEIDMVRWVIDYSEVGIEGGLVERTLPANAPIGFAASEPGNINVSAIGYSNIVKEEEAYKFDDMYKPIPGASAAFTLHFEEPITYTVTNTTHDVYTVEADTIGFPLSIGLSGWDYDKRRKAEYSNLLGGYTTPASANGARPFWAAGSNLNGSITRGKAIDAWGGGLRLVDDYIPVMQPAISDIVLSAYSCMTYKTNTPIRWVQPVEMNVGSRDRRWCKLYVDKTKSHVLSGELVDDDFRQIVACATDESSDILLEPYKDGDDVTVNYWANNSFTWHETVTDLSNGLAPTGGLYIDEGYTLYSDARLEYANMTNRHFPTVAAAPYLDSMYHKEDVGGYVLPQYLGASIAVSRNTRSELNIGERTIDDDGQMVNDKNTYAKDNGLSKIDNNIPHRMVSNDVGWMKTSMMNGVNAGAIKGMLDNQQFMPYRSVTESRNGFNDIGVVRCGDILDPWYGETDLTWRSDIYDRHFTGQLPISTVRKSYIVTDKIKTWTHDIYGYSYGILKDIDDTLPYQSAINKERFSQGKVYIRRNDTTIDLLEKYLKSIKIEGKKFYWIDVFFDTLILLSTDEVIYYKLVFDDTEVGYKILDDVGNARIVNIGNDVGDFLGLFKKEVDHGLEINVKCVGTWMHTKQYILDTVFLVMYEDEDEGITYYTYVIDSMDINSMKSKRIRYCTRSIEPLNLDDDDTKFDSNYTMIGPFIDYLDGKYTFVFQIRSAADRIGRFVRTVINSSNGEEKWEMVKKLDFSKQSS